MEEVACFGGNNGGFGYVSQCNAAHLWVEDTSSGKIPETRSLPAGSNLMKAAKRVSN